MKHKLFNFLIGFAAITLMLNTLLVTSPQKVLAAAFVVDSNGDEHDAKPGNGICLTANGTCTLRAAIEEANIFPGVDHISIPAMTITINNPLRLSQSVVIEGAGQDLTIIDGNHATQVFYFGARTGSHSISNLTIRNGDATLKNANLPGRQVNNKDGGGIFNEATLTVTYVTVTGNKANHGGGIYNEFAFKPDGSSSDLNIPMLILNNVIISNNSSNAVDVNQGGGGLHNGSCFQGDHVTILSNTSANQGGGYFNDSNCGTYPGTFVPGPDVTLNNFVISGNTSKFGGGVNHDLGMGPVTLSNGLISGNTSECCYTDPKGVTYQTGGGGIYNQGGTFRLINVVVANNKATSPAGYGGGIVNVWGNMTLQNVTIYGNETAYGAGIYNGGIEIPSLMPPDWTMPHNKLVGINLTVTSNVGKSSDTPVNQATGGGIYNTDYGKITLVNSTIVSNTSRFAGGINNKPDAIHNDISMVNSILAYNQSILYPADDPGLFTPECWGTIMSNGFNILLGNPALATCNFLPVSSDKLNTDPLLLPLRYNLGSVPTHGLRSNSPAIDAGNSDPLVCPPTDARGVLRPQSGKPGGIRACDIGAYEYKLFYNYLMIIK